MAHDPQLRRAPGLFGTGGAFADRRGVGVEAEFVVLGHGGPQAASRSAAGDLMPALTAMSWARPKLALSTPLRTR